MPLEKPEDFALGDPKSLYCGSCTDQKGKLLPYEEILAMNAKYYVDSQGITPNAAQRMAKALLDSMPAWKGRLNQLPS
jgi:hypothetical protein